MKRQVAIALPVVIVVAGLALYKRGGPSKEVAVVASGSADSPAEESVPAIAPGKKEEAAVVSSNTAAPSNTVANTPKAAEFTKPDFKFEKELSSYKALKAKVLVSQAEKAERERLLRDPAFLRGLEVLVKAPLPDASDEQLQQAAAIDALFEALNGPSSSVAAAVLKSVVQDARIENPSVPVNERKQLAGVKAEVLYNWLAMQPSKNSELQSWLPGKASQTIWQNVLAAQKANQAESRVSR